ncbi:MAG: hypothetical protein K6T83_24240 [Alicyclobacillus sp.]|nr:hypothetical protein [Alicyclobacillus sp.]
MTFLVAFVVFAIVMGALLVFLNLRSLNKVPELKKAGQEATPKHHPAHVTEAMPRDEGAGNHAPTGETEPEAAAGRSELPSDSASVNA